MSQGYLSEGTGHYVIFSVGQNSKPRIMTAQLPSVSIPISVPFWLIDN